MPAGRLALYQFGVGVGNVALQSVVEFVRLGPALAHRRVEIR
jgi:hypothetical protein